MQLQSFKVLRVCHFDKGNISAGCCDLDELSDDELRSGELGFLSMVGGHLLFPRYSCMPFRAVVAHCPFKCEWRYYT